MSFEEDLHKQFHPKHDARPSAADREAEFARAEQHRDEWLAAYPGASRRDYHKHCEKEGIKFFVADESPNTQQGEPAAAPAHDERPSKPNPDLEDGLPSSLAQRSRAEQDEAAAKAEAKKAQLAAEASLKAAPFRDIETGEIISDEVAHARMNEAEAKSAVKE